MIADISLKSPYRYGDNVLGARQLYQGYNVVVNQYANRYEILKFQGEHAVRRRGYESDENRVHRRNFAYKDGVLHRVTVQANIDRLLKSMKRSRNRALDAIYSYVQANDWRYFVTCTFAPDKVDRFNSSAIKRLWKLFRQRLQYYYPDSRVIAIPEPHPTSGAIHIHALVGGCDLSDWIKPAVNAKTGEIIVSSFGDTVYNLLMYEYGFSTLIDLGEDPCKLRVCNYLAKYISKNTNVDYNQRSYYRTKRLKSRIRHYLLLGQSDIDCMLSIHSAPRKGDNYSLFNQGKCMVNKRKSLDNMDVYDVVYLE